MLIQLQIELELLAKILGKNQRDSLQEVDVALDKT
jgi:hypothetical protein